MPIEVASCFQRVLFFFSFPLFTFDILCGRIAITLMIFVNYGGGGYYFFGHAVWNGEYASYSLTQFAVYECLTYSNKKNDYELSLVNSCDIVFYYMARSAGGQYAANSVF